MSSARSRTELAERVAASPAGTVVVSDFDGTLAPIVPSPPDARPEPAAVDALERLARAVSLVGVISGRPLEFLDPFFGSDVRLGGLYGIEQRVRGERVRLPEAEPWIEVVADAATRAEGALPPTVLVENKLASLTLHYRADPTLARQVEAFARAEADSSGLEMRSAKMSVELHPPLQVDKGTTLRSWAEGASLVVFAGDDVGDLTAFGALGDIAAAGLTTCAVVVAGAELPDEVRRVGDLVLDTPSDWASLLGELAAAAS